MPYTVTRFAVPTAQSGVSGITVGPDGNLWFTEQHVRGIGRITTTGTMTQFPLPMSSFPQDITTGPDGALWFTQPTGNWIGRITVR